MGRFDLTDRQWRRLEPLLPPQRPRTGRPNDDHRRIVNGIPWVPRTGAPWRDLPERYGPVGTVSSRFYRWRAAGVWDRALAALQAAADARGRIDWDLLHFVRGRDHRPRPPARRGRPPGRRAPAGGEALGRSQGGFSTIAPGRSVREAVQAGRPARGPRARRGRRQADRPRPHRWRAAREPTAPGPALARRGPPPRAGAAAAAPAAGGGRQGLHRPAGPRLPAPPRH